MKFYEVFDELKCDDKRLKAIFEGTDIADILSSEKLASLDIYTESDRFIKADDRRKMETLLFNQYFEPENKNVHLHIRYTSIDSRMIRRMNERLDA